MLVALLIASLAVAGAGFAVIVAFGALGEVSLALLGFLLAVTGGSGAIYFLDALGLIPT